MKKHHTIIVLLTLFFTGLIILWWADYADVPTNEELRQRSELVLPELRDTSTADIRQIEVTQRVGEAAGASSKSRRLRFERRGEGWQLLEPADAAADPPRLESLAQNLKHLRKSPYAGSISESASSFELDPPRATIRAMGKDGKVLASLDIGKVIRDQLYVRPGGAPGIEVVDARAFQGIEQPAEDWRDQAVFSLPTFQVVGFSVSGRGRKVKGERLGGHWRLTEPIRSLADDVKVEEVLAELTSLRVAGGSKGFVADGVKDLQPYGLGQDALRVELVPVSERGTPQVLLIGSKSPDSPENVYAKRHDQDDVILINGKGLMDLGSTPNALRSKKVTDFNPALVNHIRIEAHAHVFDLVRTQTGWDLVLPSRTKVDVQNLAGLVGKLNDLQASEFFDPSQIPNPELDPPLMRIKVWQMKPGQKPPAGPTSAGQGAPDVDLALGRHDALRKTVYGRIEGESTILALPDPLLEVLPRDQFAYRDRSILTLSPTEVTRLTIEQNGRAVTLTPGQARDPNRWQMIAPVEAAANDEAVTKVLMILSNLGADRLISDSTTDLKPFGLDKPTLTVSWSTASAMRSLRVGAKMRGKETSYASVDGYPYIFTLTDSVVLPFREEFRDRHVFSFPLKNVQGIVLSRGARTLRFVHHPTPQGGPSDWNAEQGPTGSEFSLSRIDALASDLGKLQTRKFIQYRGLFPDSTGLRSPQLTIAVQMADRAGNRELRVGNPAGGEEYYATSATGPEGPVFLLSGTGWSALLSSASTTGSELPADVFAPSPAK